MAKMTSKLFRLVIIFTLLCFHCAYSCLAVEKQLNLHEVLVKLPENDILVFFQLKSNFLEFSGN